MSESSSAADTELVIISGVSGSGKSTALNAFEDNGFSCVDNLPVPLLAPFVDFILAASAKEQAAPPELAAAAPALGSAPGKRYALLLDCREDSSFANIRAASKRLKEVGVSVSLLFFDCQDEVVVRRFRETRRPHPLMLSGNLFKTITGALAKERELLAEFREAADRIIDTSSYSPHELRRVVERYCGGENKLEVFLTSFGFKYGAPFEADLLLDVRFLPNPHFVAELKPKSGMADDVAEYVFENGDAEELCQRYAALLQFLIPRYAQEGKRYLTVGIGCTGGKHRSVAVAERISALLAEDELPVELLHRDLSRDRLAAKALAKK